MAVVKSGCVVWCKVGGFSVVQRRLWKWSVVLQFERICQLYITFSEAIDQLCRVACLI